MKSKNPAMFLDFLAGNQTYHCTPWGNPTRTVFGWQRPCYLLGEGYASTFRELMEETGYTASRWQKALFFYVSPGFLDESMTVYLASGLKKGVAQPEEDERIAVRFFPLRQAVGMAVSGKIVDAKTIASLLWLEKKLRGN